jgi:hypothetical protein
MVPFNDNRALAHTMLSFGFEDGDYLGVSVEVRLEKGETYRPTLGLFGQFELIYVIADERDLIRVRTEYRDVRCAGLPDERHTRTGPPAFGRCDAAGEQAARRAGVLRHAQQQLHDEHRAAHQHTRAGPASRPTIEFCCRASPISWPTTWG